ncbi:hypothetical protein Tco_1464680 [Tanacetum coccineum]
MTTTNQRISFAKIKQMVAERMANVIKTSAIYETKTRMARESMSQIKRQEDKVAENTSNKRKWEGDHMGSFSQQQNKEPKMIRAHTTGPNNKEGDAGNLPLCNKRDFTTLARVQENVAIANDLVIKLEIVGPPYSEKNRGP